jgi:hypothetical protein
MPYKERERERERERLWNSLGTGLSFGCPGRPARHQSCFETRSDTIHTPSLAIALRCALFSHVDCDLLTVHNTTRECSEGGNVMALNLPDSKLGVWETGMLDPPATAIRNLLFALVEEHYSPYVIPCLPVRLTIV